MTEIERKALVLVNEVLAEWGVLKNAVEIPKNSDAFARALLRAIERHEAFRQEVSDAVDGFRTFWTTLTPSRNEYDQVFSRFIIPNPDPLVEAMAECGVDPFESWADQLRAALAKRGLEIREKAE